MAPKDKTVFIDPLDLSEFVPGPSETTGTFSQDVIDILGNAGDSTDGFNELLAGASALVDEWDQTSAAMDADLDALLALHDTTNPAPLDNSFAAFQSSFDAGNQIITAADALSPPALGLFPINTNFNNGIPLAPIQQTVDFGTIKLNSAPARYDIGRGDQVDQTYTGIQQPGLSTGDATLWRVDFDERDSPNGNEHFTFFVAFTPKQLGQFAAVVTWYTYEGDYQQVNLALTVNVVP